MGLWSTFVGEIFFLFRLEQGSMHVWLLLMEVVSERGAGDERTSGCEQGSRR